MLNNEVKDILQEQFSMDTNYQIIMNNINKKQISYNKIFKIALLPTCAAVIAAIILPNLNNKPNEFNQGIAKANITGNIIITEQDNNIMVKTTKDNEVVETNDKEETQITQVEAGKNSESRDIKTNEKIISNDNSSQIQVARGTIYKTIEGGESSWAYDPTIPKNLINDDAENKYVVKVKILDVGEGEMLTKQENFYVPFTCFTPIKMQIVDNMLDTNKLSGTITAYMEGGKIKIANILKATPQEIEYMGIYDASQVDPEQYIEYKWSVPYYEPSIGDEYVMIINKTTPSLYQIFDGGYGIFKVEKSSDGREIYKNVISGKLLEM